MLSEKMEKALNGHMNAEFYSAYLYLSMSAYFNSVDLPGFAHWMKVQFDEEMLHGMKLFNFIDKMGGSIKIQNIEAPPAGWQSPLSVFEDTCAHERLVSTKINKLVSLAIEEHDHASNNFLQWFVAEQVEEEASVQAILKKLRLISDYAGGILILDQELGSRKEVVTYAE